MFPFLSVILAVIWKHLGVGLVPYPGQVCTVIWVAQQQQVGDMCGVLLAPCGDASPDRSIALPA